MKKTILISLITLSIIAIVNFYPKKININEQGIKYRLGTEHTETEKLVNVHIEGRVHKSMLGEKRFEGIIDMESEELPPSVDESNLKILFADDGWGAIDYFTHEYKSNGAIKSSGIYQYGSIFINDDLNKATILVADQNEYNDEHHAIWNAEKGQMITVPASSRSEGIDISNELMGEFLKGDSLE